MSDLIDELSKMSQLMKGVRTYTDEKGAFHLTNKSEKKELEEKQKIQYEKERKENSIRCSYSKVGCYECEKQKECSAYQEIESLGYEIEEMNEY